MTFSVRTQGNKRERDSSKLVLLRLFQRSGYIQLEFAILLRYGVCSSSEKRLIEGERAGKESGATRSPTRHMERDIRNVTKVEYCRANVSGPGSRRR